MPAPFAITSFCETRAATDARWRGYKWNERERTYGLYTMRVGLYTWRRNLEMGEVYTLYVETLIGVTCSETSYC